MDLVAILRSSAFLFMNLSWDEGSESKKRIIRSLCRLTTYNEKKSEDSGIQTYIFLLIDRLNIPFYQYFHFGLKQCFNIRILKFSVYLFAMLIVCDQ